MVFFPNDIHDHKMTPTNGFTKAMGPSMISSKNSAADRLTCPNARMPPRRPVRASGLAELIEQLLCVRLLRELRLLATTAFSSLTAWSFWPVSFKATAVPVIQDPRIASRLRRRLTQQRYTLRRIATWKPRSSRVYRRSGLRATGCRPHARLFRTLVALLLIPGEIVKRHRVMRLRGQHELQVLHRIVEVLCRDIQIGELLGRYHVIRMLCDPIAQRLHRRIALAAAQQGPGNRPTSICDGAAVIAS